MTDRTSSSNLSGLARSNENKTYTMQGFINKLNKSEPNTFGNYFVDFSEMFPDISEIPK